MSEIEILEVYVSKHAVYTCTGGIRRRWRFLGIGIVDNPDPNLVFHRDACVFIVGD
jgi:hypothetical protein